MIAPIPTHMIITSTPTATPSPLPLKPVVDTAMQVVYVHSPLINGFDIRQVIGLGGLTLVESFVKYLQNQWAFPKNGMVPVIISLFAGISLNLAIAAYLGMDITNAFIVGVFTGVSASMYHEATK